jgi:hypothetical protein
MAHSYKFALIRLAPDDVRGERINIGIVVIRADSLDVRVTRTLDRAKVLSAALDRQSLVDLLSNLRNLDEQARSETGASFETRLERLSRVGPLSLAAAGSFSADSQSSYESRIQTILQQLVEPEPLRRAPREKKTRLFSQVKKVLRDRRILARRDEGLDSHRIVAGYELDEGLVADLVLRNGSYHIFETVDATGDEGSFRRAISEIAVSALVLERARMRFGEKATKSRLIYSASAALEKLARPSLDAAAHQGAELINWSSAYERSNFLVALSPLATPLEGGKAKLFASMAQGKLFH